MHAHKHTHAHTNLHVSVHKNSRWMSSPKHACTHTHTFTLSQFSPLLIAADLTPSSEPSDKNWEKKWWPGDWVRRKKSRAGTWMREAGSKRKMMRDGWQWSWARGTINLEWSGKGRHSDGELQGGRTRGESERGVRLHGVMTVPRVGRPVIVLSIEQGLSAGY